jgi:hypothetical protein
MNILCLSYQKKSYKLSILLPINHPQFFFAKNIYMKQIYLFFSIAFLLIGAVQAQVPFTQGNLVVYTVGNGTDTLSSAGFVVNLQEYSTTGVLVRSHPLPTSISGNNKRIIASGSR